MIKCIYHSVIASFLSYFSFVQRISSVKNRRRRDELTQSHTPVVEGAHLNKNTPLTCKWERWTRNVNTQIWCMDLHGHVSDAKSTRHLRFPVVSTTCKSHDQQNLQFHTLCHVCIVYPLPKRRDKQLQYELAHRACKPMTNLISRFCKSNTTRGGKDNAQSGPDFALWSITRSLVQTSRYGPCLVKRHFHRGDKPIDNHPVQPQIRRKRWLCPGKPFLLLKKKKAKGREIDSSTLAFKQKQMPLLSQILKRENKD